MGGASGAKVTKRNGAAFLLAVLLLVPWPGRAAEVQVLTAGAFRAVLLAVAPAVQRDLGATLVIRNDTAGGVARRLREGDAADLVVLPPAAAAPVAASLGPLRPLARVGIAVAVREGAARPAIATEADVRAALLAARAPAWIDPASGGSSGIHMAALVRRWGMADRLHPVLVPGGLVADALLSGQADLGFQQMSELRVPGMAIVGPLPPSIQSYTVYAGAVAARSPRRAAAEAVLDWLASPRAAAALQEEGMEAP